MGDLTSKTLKGSAWMVAMRFSVNALGLISTAVLARLLSPQDFGLVALAGSAYTFFSMFGQFGFDIPLIHMRSADRSHYDTAWTANILVGCGVALTMFLIGRPAALYFQEPRIEHIVYAFSLLSLAKGFENIGIVNFRKELAFYGEFLYFVLPKLASLIVGVTAAFILRSYWALVIGMVSFQVVGLLYSHFAQPYRPRFSLERFSELFTFGKWILVSKLLRFVTFNGMEITLGKLVGPAAVGLYGISRQISFLPSTEVAAPINRALFPSFATIANDVGRLRSAYGRTIATSALLSIPAAFGIMSIAHPLISVVFGDKWLPAIPVLEVMSVVGVLYALNNSVEPVFMARGALRRLVSVQACFAAVLVPAAITLVLREGPIGVAWALLLSSGIALPLNFYAMQLEIGFGLFHLGRCLWRPVLAATGMWATVRALDNEFLGGNYNGLTLIALIAAGATSYAIYLLTLWALSGRPREPEKLLLDLFAKRLLRRSSPVT